MEKLRENNESLGLAAVSVSGVIRKTNSAAAALLGLPEDSGDASFWAVSGFSEESVLQQLRENGYFRGVRDGACEILVVPSSPGELIVLCLPLKQEAESAKKEEQLETIGKMGAKLGHDFNNLLGAFSCCLDILEAKLRKICEGQSPNPFERQIKIMRSSLRKSFELTSRLRGYVRPGPTHLAPNRLGLVVRQVTSLIREADIVPFEIDMNIDCDPPVMLNEMQVTEMLLNLCLNSIEAMSSIEDRLLVITLGETEGSEERELKPGRYAHLAIVDHGVGMTADVLAKAFQPFFSTKAGGIGRGMGLALAMSQEIMKRHGGRIEMASIPGCGTIAHLYFPIIESADAKS